MAKGRWKRRVAWIFVILIVAGVTLALTRRAWIPTAVRIVLKSRGIQVQKIAWEGKDAWTFEGVRHTKAGLTFRARSVRMFTPNAWQAALRAGNTNDVYVRVNGWRVILAETRSGAPSTNSIADRIRDLNVMARKLHSECPRAVFLNGTIQSGKREFNMAAIEWKGGELSGDLTWPMLNDPADFRLKLIETNKVQLILKQTALEIGSRISAETLTDGARLAGYARWTTNRADFDLLFPARENTPNSGFIESKGIALPGRLLDVPAIETLNARTRLVITNGQFEFNLGAPESAQ